MTPGLPKTAGSTLTTLLFVTVIVVALYVGREVLVPIALAILMSFVLAPFVRKLHDWRIPRLVAVLLVVIVAFSAILVAGGMIVSQVNQLATDLPRYQATLREKIQTVRGMTGGSGTLEKAAEVLQDLNSELRTPGKITPTPDRPVLVEIRQPYPGALQTLVGLITPLVNPLATTGIVFLFVVFILLQREDLRNRLIRLGGVADLQRTTAAIDDAGHRLSRLFLAQLALNAAFGVVIGTGLFFIGVPSAPLWGLLAMVLRFVPYIGAVLAAVFPLVLAAAVGPDWTMVFWTVALFAIAEPLTGHVIEPLVTGHSSGLSPVAVIASATFWTWLWGPIGLILATPLTVCLVVIGRHVDRLKFLDVMFGDEPALSPAQLVYQRMLAGDAIEAVEQAEIYLMEKSLTSFYEDVLLESFALGQADALSGNVDEDRLERIRAVAAEIISDLSAHEESPKMGVDDNEGFSGLKTAEGGKAGLNKAVVPGSAKLVLCIPGPGALDESFALIVAQLVERRGIAARAEGRKTISVGHIFSLDTSSAALLCLCCLKGTRASQIRYAVRRLLRKAPDVPVILARIGSDPIQADDVSELESVSVGVTLDATLALIEKQVAARHVHAQVRTLSPDSQREVLAGQKSALADLPVS
jgi:predicted PurR-regulated permease PerM